MNFNALNSGSAMSAYVSSLLSKSQNADATGVEAGTAGDKLMKAATEAALQQAAKGAKAASGQRQLESKASTIATELQAAMKKANVKLAGPVEFTVSSDGKLALRGNEKDVDAATAFLEKDQTSPGFRSRIASLNKDADALSGTVRQNAAISQAARYAANSSGVLSLYSSLLQRQDSTPAVFTLSSSGGSLTYPGMLRSSA